MSTLIMKPAPHFTARAVMADNSVKEDFSSTDMEGKYWFLFFYPFDFSIVCPTEMLALNERLDEFPILLLRGRAIIVWGTSARHAVPVRSPSPKNSLPTTAEDRTPPRDTPDFRYFQQSYTKGKDVF